VQKSTHESRRITALELVWGPSLSYITSGTGCRMLKPHQLDSMNTSVTKKITHVLAVYQSDWFHLI